MSHKITINYWRSLYGYSGRWAKGWSLVLIVLFVSCGGSSQSTPPPTNDLPTLVEVVNGYGTGFYTAGQTVHVWSAVSTTQEIGLPWTGDASILADSKEWQSSFIMPSRPIRVVANKATFSMTLVAEQYTGSTSTPKRVLYCFPSNMRGVVLFSHGTGGSSSYIESTEGYFLALALVQRGYGVISTDCEETVAGDLNGDGKLRWLFTGATPGSNLVSNIDLKNLEILFQNFQTRGLIQASIPKFALGMSAGGSFSLFLGSLSNLSAASVFPQLRFRAVISYCADGGASLTSASTTPSAWYMAAQEDNSEVSNIQARANALAMSGRGIATEHIEHPPTPIYNERFSRISTISIANSTAMVNELRAAGFINTEGYLNQSGDFIQQFIVSNPSRFPIIIAQSANGGVLNQIKVMRAEHAMYGDYAQRTITFFNRFNPIP